MNGFNRVETKFAKIISIHHTDLIFLCFVTISHSVSLHHHEIGLMPFVILELSSWRRIFKGGS